MIQNPGNDSARSGYDDSRSTRMARSTSISGRSAPAGPESNWIETLPGKDFYPFFRFYGPTEGAFDGSWKMPDVELMK